jgi:hypothetical protein
MSVVESLAASRLPWAANIARDLRPAPRRRGLGRQREESRRRLPAGSLWMTLDGVFQQGPTRPTVQVQSDVCDCWVPCTGGLAGFVLVAGEDRDSAIAAMAVTTTSAVATISHLIHPRETFSTGTLSIPTCVLISLPFSLTAPASCLYKRTVDLGRDGVRVARHGWGVSSGTDRLRAATGADL